MKPSPRKPSTFFPDDDRNARPLYESVAPINGAEQMNRRRNPFTNQKQPRWRRSLPPILSAYSRSTQLLKETACAALIVSCRVGESLVRQLSRGRASLVRRRTFQRPSIATALGCTLLALAGFRFLMPRSAADQPRADSLESTVATHHWRPRGDVRLPDPNVSATSGRGSNRTARGSRELQCCAERRAECEGAGASAAGSWRPPTSRNERAGWEAARQLAACRRERFHQWRAARADTADGQRRPRRNPRRPAGARRVPVMVVGGERRGRPQHAAHNYAAAGRK
jgi:hypothetical protein